MTRKKLFKDFMKVRILMALQEEAHEIFSGARDSKFNPISVKILPESRFNGAADDILKSIDEYYTEFLTCKIATEQGE